MDTTEVISIHEDFYSFYKKYKKLDEVASAGDQAIIECIELLHLLEKRVAKEMIFSSGETIEDVHTVVLKFGLIPHYMSELYTIKNPPNRTRWLRLSDMYAKQFINQSHNWSILSVACECKRKNTLLPRFRNFEKFAQRQFFFIKKKKIKIIIKYEFSNLSFM
ncbi:hypothetical protein RFI_14005 [Reticulomyxa filosa]|uniref:Uncharacterized protein n=1 Tax=Reticulomyxa filosa TaxID=46433 RepID=X6NBM2_RETFI|nr:hypothetical protein RFI_14005 [Reticulomyxa filosa]|eukprot:ETO23179.1 hypothetical protein RFI_14005 [Reticulomyxa filosa]